MCDAQSETYHFDVPFDTMQKSEEYKKTCKMEKFKNIFGKSHVLLPVIHVKNYEQALSNCKMCFECGVDGVWLINHDCSSLDMIDIIKKIRYTYPTNWIGANFVDLYPHEVFNRIQKMKLQLDGVWTDNAMINEDSNFQNAAEFVNYSKFANSWNGLYFGGIAFKYRTEPKSVGKVASIAQTYVDVVTTSGNGNGHQMPLSKALEISSNVTNAPVAVASGITHQNILTYKPYVNCFMVSSCIEEDFYNFDRAKLNSLVSIVKSMNEF
jgi:hypothetical protein